MNESDSRTAKQGHHVFSIRHPGICTQYPPILRSAELCAGLLIRCGLSRDFFPSRDVSSSSPKGDFVRASGKGFVKHGARLNARRH